MLTVRWFLYVAGKVVFGPMFPILLLKFVVAIVTGRWEYLEKQFSSTLMMSVFGK